MGTISITPAENTSTGHELSLSLVVMRQKEYPGSDLKIEQTLTSKPNYNQYIASYLSDGLTIYGLLTVPKGSPPEGGWPAIIFNHGYIQPDIYTTTGRYVAYVDYFARNGYIVFKSDYRGNGKSEGDPEGSYYSPAYTTDVLNALSSIKKYPGVNPDKIGMWGHSMGGNITLRSLEISPDIKAAVIWGGVTGSYNDLINNWPHKSSYRPGPRELQLRNQNRQTLISLLGSDYASSGWQAIDPTYHLDLINTPIQLDHGLADNEVPVEFSDNLKLGLDKIGKKVEYYTYPEADHNISQSFSLAMSRSLAFFDQYLK